MRDLLQPWHLLVFALAGFLFFGAIGLLEKSGRNSGPRNDR